MSDNLVGLDKVMSNFNRQVDEIQGRTVKGLYEAGLMIQAGSQKKVPVEYGFLRASAFTRIKDKVNVEVGFSAKYAVYVHENMEQKLKGQPRPSGLGVYWGPQGQPKFLESTVTELSGQLLDIIAKSAKFR